MTRLQQQRVSSKVYSPKSIVCRPRPRRRAAAAGFTLLELLIVIALMIVLAGLMIPAFYKVQNEGRKKQAQIEGKVIESAIQAYRLQMRKLPAPDGDLRQGARDFTYGDAQSDDSQNATVLRLLRDSDPPVLDEGKLRWDGDNVINPWGRQYQITLDLNYDGKIGGESVEYKVEWNLQ